MMCKRPFLRGHGEYVPTHGRWYEHMVDGGEGMEGMHCDGDSAAVPHDWSSRMPLWPLLPRWQSMWTDARGKDDVKLVVHHRYTNVPCVSFFLY